MSAAPVEDDASLPVERPTVERPTVERPVSPRLVLDWPLGFLLWGETRPIRGV